MRHDANQANLGYILYLKRGWVQSVLLLPRR